MNAQTAAHLDAWLRRTVREDRYDATLDTMLAFLADYPDLPETRTWPEILRLAERHASAEGR